MRILTIVAVIVVGTLAKFFLFDDAGVTRLTQKADYVERFDTDGLLEEAGAGRGGRELAVAMAHQTTVVMRQVGSLGGIEDGHPLWPELMGADDLADLEAWREATAALKGYGWAMFFHRALVVQGPADAQGARYGLYDPLTDVWLVVRVKGPASAAADAIEDLHLMTSARLLGRERDVGDRTPEWARRAAREDTLYGEVIADETGIAMRAFQDDIPEATQDDQQRALNLLSAPLISMMPDERLQALHAVAADIRDRGDGLSRKLRSLPDEVLKSLIVTWAFEKNPNVFFVSRVMPHLLIQIVLSSGEDGVAIEWVSIDDIDPDGLSLGSGYQSSVSADGIEKLIEAYRRYRVATTGE